MDKEINIRLNDEEKTFILRFLNRSIMMAAKFSDLTDPNDLVKTKKLLSKFLDAFANSNNNNQ